MKSVGIDIGNSHIKLVEVQSTSKGIQVLSYQVHPLSLAQASDREIEVIEYLRDIADRYDAATTRFNFAMSSDRVAIRNKIFPFSDRIKINKSLAFELEEDIPFSAESSVFDAKIIQYHGHATEVLACAIPKQHVENILRVIHDGGIDPFLIGAEAAVLANLSEKWFSAPPSNPALPEGEDAPRRERPISIVLNIGHHRTLVSAYENSRLVGARSIMWGGQQILEAIAKKYNLPPKEAQKEMELKSFILYNNQNASYEAKIFSDLIAQQVRELGRDLQLVLLEFRAEFNGQIERMDMTGGVSLIQGLGPFLTQLLEVPVNRYHSLENFPNILFEKNDFTEARLGVALGLAIEGLKKPRNPPVNFLKGELAKQSNALKVFWRQWGPSVQWGAAMLVVLFAWTITRSYFSVGLEQAAKDNLRQQAKNVANLSGRSATETKIKEHIRQSAQRADELKKLTSLAQMNSSIEILKKISDATPSKDALALDLRVMNVADSQVTMQGYLNSQKELTLLQQALTNIAEGGRVNANTPTLGAWKNKTRFSFSFNVDRNIQRGTQ